MGESTSMVTSNKCIAVRKVATPLRELTCHMGSHSVTCHPAEVTFPPLVWPTLGSRTAEGQNIPSDVSDLDGHVFRAHVVGRSVLVHCTHKHLLQTAFPLS